VQVNCRFTLGGRGMDSVSVWLEAGGGAETQTDVVRVCHQGRVALCREKEHCQFVRVFFLATG